MIDSHITERLSDRRSVGRAVNLPIDRARAGARRLAAVATLSGTTSFPIRDGATTAEVRDHPVAILTDWRRDEVLELFQLPIFDEGTPTTLRIHVKDVQEYLCAEWLREQLRTNLLTRDRLVALLFRPDGRAFVVPPHLTKVAADAETLLQAGSRNVRRFAIVVLDFRGPPPASRKVRKRRPRAKPHAKKPDAQAATRKRPPGRSIKEPGKKAKKSPRGGRRR